MAVDTLPQFLQALRDSALLTPEQWAELKAFHAQCPDVRALAREFIKRGWLTPYQVNQVVRGRGKDLVLGVYHLLEPLGEGGMGQVFKARHTRMKRVVALKIIRAERLKSPDALRRFQREIEAAARLSHPNVVIAHDAAQVGNTHFFVMEYVAGTDLGKLLHKRGALPVGEACEYVRQAALGLQHAHEHGMVHRDVKPSNLLLTTGGTVKVLDMGLARLGATTPEESVTALTEDGTLMGTPDYMAPEQADDAHMVDIRADVYSLGCTLYALLTARAPFAGGSLAKKIAAHLHAEPPPLHNLRPDLPPPLAAVVRRMMAKGPEQRYQTPADVAVALAPFCRPAAAASSGGAIAGASAAPVADASTVAVGDRTEAAVGRTTESRTVPATASRRAPRWLLPAGAGGALLLVLLVWLIVRGLQGDGAGGQGGAGPLQPGPKAGALELDPDAPTVEVRRFTGHTQQVNSVALSADSRLVVSGSSDRSVRLWDGKTGEFLNSFEHEKGVWSVAVSADGKHVLAGEGGWWEGGEFKTAPPYEVVLWDVLAKTSSRHFKGYKTDVLGVAFVPGSRRLLAGTVGEGVWLGEMDGGGAPRRVADGGGGFGNIALSGDGRFALLSEWDHSLRLWDAKTWEGIRALKGQTEAVRALALSADGRRALCSGWDKVVRQWDATTGKELRALLGHPTIATGLALSPDGRWAATGGGTVAAPDGKGARNAGFDNVIRLFDLESGKEVRRFEGHTSAVMGLVFSADGRYLLSGSCDGTVRLWRWAK